MWATNVVVSCISASAPSPKVSFVIPAVETGHEEEQREPSGTTTEAIPIDPDSIAHEVLMKVCDQLFIECADRVISESVPDDVQEPSQRVDEESVSVLPPADAMGSQTEGSSPKSNRDSPLSISSDSDNESEGNVADIGADIQTSPASAQVNIPLKGSKFKR
jgi:hypothetical protein